MVATSSKAGGMGVLLYLTEVSQLGLVATALIGTESLLNKSSADVFYPSCKINYFCKLKNKTFLLGKMQPDSLSIAIDRLL